MSIHIFRQIRTAIKHLNPEEVQRTAECPLKVGIVASSSSGYADIEEFLLPTNMAAERRTELMHILYRLENVDETDFNLVLYEQGLPCPAEAFTFFREDPVRTINEILEEKDELQLPLARSFFWFRKPAIDAMVQKVARENALFAMATALPNIVPFILPLPWAVSEFASDTAFLTMNQIRLAFLIAASHNQPIGYSQQKAQIATIVAGAFGWRAIARELVGKIPMGRGLIPKGAVAYAGTYVIGKGLQRYHEVGYGYTPDERGPAYEAAYEQGKGVASGIIAESGRQPSRVLQ